MNYRMKVKTPILSQSSHSSVSLNNGVIDSEKELVPILANAP